MKSIPQLLQLAKNPYYKLTNEEQQALDAFLAMKRGSQDRPSQGKSLTDSSKKTRVTVRNVVEKMDTYPPDSRVS
jgi:hypothetical protein